LILFLALLLAIVAKTSPVNLFQKYHPRRFLSRERLVHWTGLIGKFATIQLVVQIISFFTGFLVIRIVDKNEYAYFTLANTVQGMMGLLADAGASVALLSVGGQVYQDRERFGSLINSVIRVRFRMAMAAMALGIPILFGMLVYNKSSWLTAFLLTLITMIAFHAMLMSSIYGIVPKLWTQVKRLQSMDLSMAVGRLAFLAVFIPFKITAVVAMAVSSVVYLFQYRFFKRWASESANLQAGPNDKDTKTVVSNIRSLIPATIFYCVQTQIPVWLIGISGSTDKISDVGALGRIAQVFGLLTPVMASLVMPAFARSVGSREVKRKYAVVIASYSVLCLFIIAGTWIFSDQFLWLLGPGYAGLKYELVLMAVSTTLTSLAGVMWGLNSAKGWVQYIWIDIPIRICLQAVLLMFMDVKTVSGVLLFSIFSQASPLLVCIWLARRGFRSIETHER